MPRVGFKPTISAGKRLQTYALDRAATGTGNNILELIFTLLVIELHTSYFKIVTWSVVMVLLALVDYFCVCVCVCTNACVRC